MDGCAAASQDGELGNRQLSKVLPTIR